MQGINYKQVLQQLNNHGFQAYLVGGCLRDILLGLEPKDWDICTDALPEQIKKIFPNNYPVGESFGIIKVNWNNILYDIATFRSENDYTDGRRPDVIKFETDPKKDVERRDFTINGLLMDINDNILDFVGGKKDLESKVIRCIGNPNERFQEDYLRILRAIRFGCRFSFMIEQNTWREMCIHSSGLEMISQERITEEFKGILTSKFPAIGIANLLVCNAILYILPELKDLIGVQQPPKYHKYDVFNHTLAMIKESKIPLSFTLAMAILLHDIAKPKCKGLNNGQITFYGHEIEGDLMAKEICERLKLSNDETNIIRSHVLNHMKPHQAKSFRKNTLTKLCRLPDFEDFLELHRLDCLCSMGNMETYDLIASYYQENRPRINRKPFINGNHLIALGIKPGPIYKQILSVVEDAQLNEEIKTTGQAIDLAISLFEK